MPHHHQNTNMAIISQVEKLEQQYHQATLLLRANKEQDQALIKKLHEHYAPQFSKRDFIFHTLAKKNYLTALICELKNQAQKGKQVNFKEALKGVSQSRQHNWPVFVDGVNQLLQSQEFKDLENKYANMAAVRPLPTTPISRPLPKSPLLISSRPLPNLPLVVRPLPKPPINQRLPKNGNENINQVNTQDKREALRPKA